MALGYPPPDAGKAAWRAWAKARRGRLEQDRLSAAVVAALRAWPRYQGARHVLSYAAFGSELDMSALYADPDKSFYLTRARPDFSLSVHPLSGGLEQHAYGFWQPSEDAPEGLLEVIDLVLAPGLCFDERGARLDYGKGFYDRLLPRLRPSAPRVGVTAEALVVPRLPAEPFDAFMTHLATEAGVREV